MNLRKKCLCRKQKLLQSVHCPLAKSHLKTSLHSLHFGLACYGEEQSMKKQTSYYTLIFTKSQKYSTQVGPLASNISIHGVMRYTTKRIKS